MRKLVTFGIAAVAILIAVGAVAVTARHSDRIAATVSATAGSVFPLEMMKGAKNLPEKEYDKF